MIEITLRLDHVDYRLMQEAIAKRQTWRCLPDSESCTAGRVLAEICRGWLEHGSEPPDATESWKEA